MKHQLRKKQPRFALSTQNTLTTKAFSMVSIIFGAIFIVPSPVASTEAGSPQNSSVPPLLYASGSDTTYSNAGPTQDIDSFARRVLNPSLDTKKEPVLNDKPFDKNDRRSDEAVPIKVTPEVREAL